MKRLRYRSYANFCPGKDPPIPMQKHQEYWIIKKIGYLSMSLPDSQTIRAIGSQITFYDMINSIFSEKV